LIWALNRAECKIPRAGTCTLGRKPLVIIEETIGWNPEEARML
jgi:hypothetical protein